MNYVLIIKAVLALLPTIIEAVKAIEEAIPESGQGKFKLEIVRKAVESAYNVAGDAVVKFDQLWPAIQNVITTFVEFANKIGLFKK